MPPATILPKSFQDYFWAYPRSRYGPLRNPRDLFWVPYFLAIHPFSVKQRYTLLREFYRITFRVRCFHAQHEIIEFAQSVLSMHPERRGVLVECGAYKGGATSKFSRVAKLLNTKLIVYDSFQGLPENSEKHDKSIFGDDIHFPGGRFCASLNEVKGNVGLYGSLSSCEFRPGWFKETLPYHQEPISAAFIDVDLKQSTHDCLRYLYPKLLPGGSIFSQDGHVPMVVDLIGDLGFWSEINAPRPAIFGLGTRKLIRITKPSSRPSI